MRLFRIQTTHLGAAIIQAPGIYVEYTGIKRISHSWTV